MCCKALRKMRRTLGLNLREKQEHRHLFFRQPHPTMALQLMEHERVQALQEYEERDKALRTRMQRCAQDLHSQIVEREQQRCVFSALSFRCIVLAFLFFCFPFLVFFPGFITDIFPHVHLCFLMLMLGLLMKS